MTQQITQVLPDVPSPPAPNSDTFDSEMEAHLRALDDYRDAQATWTTQANAVAVEIDENAVAAAESATSAETSASASEAARAAAVTAKTAAETAKTGAETAAGTATTKAADATTQAGIATTKAAEAAASVASVSPGSDPWQLVRAGDLGTAAWLDQTWFYTSATWDAPSCAHAAQVSTAVAVPGAEIGDKVFPSASIALSGLNLRGEVTATDVVTLYLSNLTGSAVDLASATYYITVLKRTPAR